jgi:hypothetical protein
MSLATYARPHPTRGTHGSCHRPREHCCGEAAKKDNLRRLKYPVFVTEHEDGTRSFVHDPGVIRDGLISSSAADRGAQAPIPRGADGYGAEARPSPGPTRDAQGRFAKGTPDDARRVPTRGDAQGTLVDPGERPTKAMALSNLIPNPKSQGMR